MSDPLRPDRTDAFNLAEALDAIPGDLELAVELAELFRQEYARVSAEMRQALAAGTTEPVRRGAHMLKSSAGIFAAHAAAAAAYRLELIAAARDLFATTAALEEFDREAARLIAALDRHFPPSDAAD